MRALLAWTSVGTLAAAPVQLDLADDLACSACSFVSRSMRLLLSSKLKYKNKAEKGPNARKLLRDACKEDRYPSQLAVIGDPGKQEFVDFQDVMNNGGTVTNMVMDGKQRGQMKDACLAIMDSLEDDIVRQVEQTKGRVGGYNWEKFICVSQSGLCRKTKFQKDEEEDEEL
mmetsp:Transcript_72666/g.193847  ORF Transcript_72666/g.193847 Transcript_72666/m.193847 type:complete len:171 (-) Transcript_72666:8-520(-)